MKFRLNASEDNFNIQKQALYCINQSHKYMESRKKQQNFSKLCFEYILPKSNKQKIFANLIPLSARMYPESCKQCLYVLVNEGKRFTNTQYSSMRVRKHKKEFQIHHRYLQNQQNQNSQRKYSHFLSRRKNNQHGGGLDSFWMFKKQQNKQQIKKNKKNNQSQLIKQKQQPDINKTQAAFNRILLWGKQSIDGLIPKNLLKNYIASKLGQNFASWFISKFFNNQITDFYQFRPYTTFKQFQHICQRFKNMKLRESHLVTFFLYDNNADGYICPRDVFSIFQRNLNQKVEKDVLKIAQFVRKNLNKNQGNNQEFKIQNVIIRDDWLTIKDYEMYYKKIDQPYLKATNKKDTVFSKTFAVLDHRQKIRSVRKQLNQKKSMYDQLYGEIRKQKKNHTFIQRDDYKLNYSFFYEVFKEQQTQIFKFFCDYLFNF